MHQFSVTETDLALWFLLIYLYSYPFARTSLVAQTVKNLPSRQETQVRPLGWEDLLEKGIFSEGPGQATVQEVAKSHTTEQRTLPHSTIFRQMKKPLDIIYRTFGLLSQLSWNSWASLVAQLVKSPPAMRETWVQSLGSEDSLEKGIILGFPGGSAGKESTSNVGDLGLIPGLGRSPGEGKGYSLQYSGLENSMDCIVHGVAKSQT